MEILLYISLPVLLAVLFQDVKYRAVTWFLFPVLFLIFSYINIINLGINEFAKVFLINSLLIFLHIIGLFFYFFLKHKKFVSPVNSYLGIGDILFFMVLASAFSPANFMFFLMTSLFTILFFYSFRFLFTKNIKEKIPLAGLQACMLAVLVLLSLFVEDFCFTDDSVVIGLIYA